MPAKELSLAEQLCFITTRIETIDSEGNHYTGTGFFFDLKIENDKIVKLLITNAHVIKGMTTIILNFTKADMDGNPILGDYVKIELQNFEGLWINHQDATVDLCVLPINPIINQEIIKGNKLYYRTFNSEMIPIGDAVQDLDAVEDILMVGYPVGLWDEKNNLPIIRKGITATDPKVDYNGKKEFLIDSACIHGSSGSPVLVYNKGVYSNKFGRETRFDGVRFNLLGIQYQIPLKTQSGKIIAVNVPTQTQPIPIVDIPINLGYIIKAERILDFISYFESK